MPCRNSAATTATVNDKAFDVLKAMRWQPAVRTVPPYHDDPAYIDALAQSIESHLGSLEWQPEVVIASYHGIPQSYFDKGDPYHCHCMKTSRIWISICLITAVWGAPRRFNAVVRSASTNGRTRW